MPGSIGWVRSSAWIWLFSSTQEHQRAVGRRQIEPDDIPHLLYEEQVREQLERLGAVRLQPNAPQMRRIVACDSPISCAIERSDQWVASAGVVVSVHSITSAIRSSARVRGRPDRGSSDKSSMRSLTKRRRHFPTVRSCTPSPDRPRSAGSYGTYPQLSAPPDDAAPGPPETTIPRRSRPAPPRGRPILGTIAWWLAPSSPLSRKVAFPPLRIAGGEGTTMSA